MLFRTIANNCLLVIFCGAVCLAGAACRRPVVQGGRAPAFEPAGSPFERTVVAGRIESAEITESSGITASRCQENVLWTHNDSGDGPYIFAIDKSGKDRGVWRVDNADNRDWEDIASYRDSSGRCFLLIGDIGNSGEDMRKKLTIYRVAEPAVNDEAPKSFRRSPRPTEAAEVLTFSYPDQPHDAETLMVHPASADIYIVTKQKNKAAGVYRLRSEFGGERLQADWIGELTVPAVPNGFVTGGEIAPDGSHVIICDYFAAYEFTLPARSSGFDEIWKQKPAVVELGDRRQGEAIAYSGDGNAVFATSEGTNGPLLRAAPPQ
jgi:hypothetical protein